MFFLKIASCIKLEGMDWSEFKFLEILIANCGTGLDANIIKLQFHFLTGTQTHNIVHNRSCIFAILLWFSFVCCIYINERSSALFLTIVHSCQVMEYSLPPYGFTSAALTPRFMSFMKITRYFGSLQRSILVGSTGILVHESLRIWACFANRKW